MKKIFLFGILLTAGLIIACTKKEGTEVKIASPEILSPETSVSAKQSWEKEWEKTMAIAKKEGKISIYATSEIRAAFTPFMQKYGIATEVVIGKGAEISARLINERRAGIFATDVYVGGVTTLITTIKPSGMLGLLHKTLLLPEVIDETKWLGGRVPFMDKERYIVSFVVGLGPKYVANSELVRPGDLKSYMDILNPKWKGKIILNDPTSAGAGLLWFGFMMRNILGVEKGKEYMINLVRQEPVISRDQRQQMEWLAQGKYAILIAPQRELVAQFQQIGAPIMPLEFWGEVSPITPGSGNLALLNRAPHPDAAQVFINWLLSKEGQASFMKEYGFPSARLDVPTEGIDPLFIPDPKREYFMTTEEFYVGQDDMQKLAIEIFSKK